MQNSGISRSQLLPVLAFLVMTLVIVAAAADKSKPGAQEKKCARSTDPSLYVGEETCKTWHEDMPSKGFFQQPALFRAIIFGVFLPW
jgi:hypothetical protein